MSELKPITRKEQFLAKAAGDPDAQDLEPITRTEHFLAKITGGGGGAMEPITSEEITEITDSIE